MNKATTAIRLKAIRGLAVQDLEEDMEDMAMVAISREDVTALDLAVKTVELYGVGGEDHFPADITIKDLITQIATGAIDRYLTGSLLDVLASDVAEAVIRNLPAIKELIWNEEAAKE